jgi:hypothetical protein
MTAAVVNLALLIVLYARQSLSNRVAGGGAFFVGIKALRELELVREFEAMQARPVAHLDERSLSDFFTRAHVTLPALLSEMRSIWSEVWDHLHPSQPSAGLDKAYPLSFLLMRGHQFAYVRAWFRQYASQGGTVPPVAWTTASHLAFAPIAVGIETIHMAHGLQRHSLVYADFARSVCFNGFDAAHIRRRLPRCAVSVAAEPVRCLTTRRVVAVAGTYWEPDGFDLICPFIEWALRHEVPVIVRKHPFDTSEYWEQWRGVAGVEIADGAGGFAEFLEKYRPRFLATWFSTALFDALVRGIMPVTVTPESHEALLDTVFPFRELSLCWPEHQEIVERLLDNDDRRAEFLAENYARAVGEHEDRARGAAASAKLGTSA